MSKKGTLVLNNPTENISFNVVGNELKYPLTFTAIAATRIAFTVSGTLSKSPVLQYKINDGEWTSYTLGSSVSLTSGDSCQWQGNNSNFSTGYNAYITFTSTGKISASGSIMSLLDSTLQTNIIPTTYCFYRLFKNCNNLTTAPTLSATTLKNVCYYEMFYGCSSLTTAPALPATTLTTSCYNSMFYNCSRLTTAPALPATTLAKSCYNSMFYNCSRLTTAPALPATTLAESCYSDMFYNCSSLTTAPALPATTLVTCCYYDMFYNCSKLTTAPALPATTLASSCYYDMFHGCSKLIAAPALPATTLASRCYYGMFNGCYALTTVPLLPANTMADSCYSNMFYYCKALQVSDGQTAEAGYEWKIPQSGTFENTFTMASVFTNCLGTRSIDYLVTTTGSSVTYYTQNQPV